MIKIITLCLAFLVSSSIPACAEGASNKVWFVQLSDTHLGVMDHEVVLAKMVDAINTLPFPIACVVHTGDLVMDNFDKTNVRATASALLGRIKVPVHVAPGNHDLNEQTTPSTYAAWTNRFGPPGASADYGGVRFVFVFTEGLYKKGPAGEFDPFFFLETELKRAGDRPVLLFQHSPWNEDFYGNQLRPGWSEKIAARWISLVRSGPVKAVLTGHRHRNELYWEGDVPIFAAEAAARFWNRQPAFRIFCYENGRLSYRTWMLSDAK